MRLRFRRKRHVRRSIVLTVDECTDRGVILNVARPGKEDEKVFVTPQDTFTLYYDLVFRA